MLQAYNYLGMYVALLVCCSYIRLTCLPGNEHAQTKRHGVNDTLMRALESFLVLMPMLEMCRNQQILMMRSTSIPMS